MIIACTGTKKVGKSTLIEDFIERWPKYKKPEKSYRDLKLPLINDGEDRGRERDETISHEESQRRILDFMLEDVKANYDRTNNIIHDHSTLDNLAYTIWLRRNVVDAISDDFMVESFAKVKESTHYYDIIAFVPVVDDWDDFPIPEEVDKTQRSEIDEILKILISAFHSNEDFKADFWAEKEAALPIEIYGPRDARILMFETYLDDDGGIREKEGATILDAYGRGISSKDNVKIDEEAPRIEDFEKNYE